MEKKTWLSALTALMVLSPLTAFGEDPVVAAPAPKFDPKIVSYKDAVESDAPVVKNFRAFRDGKKIVISGTIPSECASLFQFQWDDKVSGKLIFQIQDNDHGVECVKRERKVGACGTSGKCVSIKDFSFEGLKDQDLSVGYGEPQPEDDLNPFKFTAFKDHKTDQDLLVKSTKTLADEKKQRDQDRKEAKLALWKDQLAACASKSEDLPLARAALENLCSQDGEEFSSDRCAKFKKEFDKKEIDFLVKRADKARADELDDYIDELTAFAESHPDATDRLAGAFTKLAQRKLAKSSKSTADYDEARALVSKAQELDGLSDGASQRLEGYQVDLETARTRLLFQNGLANNYLAIPAFYSLMNTLQRNVMKNCGAGMNESCANAMSSYKSAAALPQVGRQVDQQKQQLQQQLYQSLYGSQTPAQGGAPNSMSLNYGMGNQTAMPFSMGFPNM